MSPRPTGAGVLAVVVLVALAATGWYAARPSQLRPVADQDLGLGTVVQAAPRSAPQQSSPVPAQTRRADPAWAQRIAMQAGIPVTAMQAYGTATLRLSQEQPGCKLGWTTLAGIGWIESQHGTMGDRALGADGRSVPPVIGPALDGQAFAAIPSTPEGVRLHGDPDWDHAMGPMQFITSTWTTWATDGDSDGSADPYDIDDAALAAGRYLCASGRDLSTASGWSAAIFSYNHSDDYVRSVYAAAESYAART